MNLNQPKTIIFHPGIGKTATSAIQQIGLSLPTNDSDKPCFSPFGVFGGAHNYFASNHPNFNEGIFEKEWRKLLDFALNKNSSTVISSEFLIRDKPAHIKMLLTEAKAHGLNIKVVVAVRNYADYLESAFLQGIKVKWGVKNDEDIFSFCKRELDNIRMNKLVDHWSRHIGDENVYLMNYDLDKSIFVDKFFDLLSISLPDKAESQNKINYSIPLSSAPFIRHFDNVCIASAERVKFIKYVSELDYNEKDELIIKEKIKNEVIKESFNHDKEILSRRYQWI